ncbi:MAG: S41 family peptidase, partial [Pyrinomonadaceae bacterium]
AFLNHTDALIIDLRQNGGGRPDMVALLASYFFKAEPRLHLNDLAGRKEGTTEYDTRESWTLTTLAGERYLDKPVYLLTSPRTFSGAEELSYDLQTQKRAIIVGETTGGGANPGGPYRLSDHFLAFMPRGYAINPITKTNWEGVGVVPDVKVPQEDALKTAQALALKQLIAKNTDPRELNGLKQALAQVEGGGAPAASAPVPASSPTGSAAPATSLAGMWTGQITDPRGSAHTMTIDLKIEGAKISGTIAGGPPVGAPETIIGGTITGDQISLDVNSVDPEGNTMKTTYAGTLTGNTITGALSSRMGSMPFGVRRK